MKILIFSKAELPLAFVKEMHFYQIHFYRYQDDHDLDWFLSKVDAVCFLSKDFALTHYAVLRKENARLPIFCFEALDFESKDPYLLQFLSETPFHEKISLMKEVLAMNAHSGVKNLGPFRLDRMRRLVKIKDREVYLTSKEFEIFELLLSNYNKVTSREQIIYYAWDRRSFVAPNTIDVYISRLKRKADFLKPALKTIHNYGYTLQLEDLAL